MEKSLTVKTLIGSGWMVAVKILNRVFGTFVSIILARILIPEDFGLVAIGMLFISFFKIFTEVGFKQALINNDCDRSNDIYHTAWTIEIIRGFSIFVLILFFSPAITRYFDKPSALQIIQVLSIVPLIHGFTNIKLIHLQKELSFRKLFVYELTGIISPMFITIPLAISFKNAWALVFGTIAGELVMVIASYILVEGRLKILLRKSHLLKLFKFGKWVFAGSIISYIAMELDTYVAAKVFTLSEMGIYTMAFSLSSKPIIELGKAISKVLFPAFSKIKNQKKRVLNAYIKSSLILFYIITPLSIGLFLVANDFVYVILGEKWLPAAPIIKILSLATFFRSLALPSGGLFFGVGKPQLLFILTLTRAVSLVGMLVAYNLHYQLDLITVANAVLFSNIIVFITNYILVVHYFGISILRFVGNYLFLFISLLALLFSVITVIHYIESGVLRLILSICVGALVYVAFVIKTNKRLIQSVYYEVRQ